MKTPKILFAPKAPKKTFQFAPKAPEKKFQFAPEAPEKSFQFAPKICFQMIEKSGCHVIKKGLEGLQKKKQANNQK